MQRGDHLCAFPHRGGDALHRIRAHVADREDAGPTRLERLAIGTGVETGAHEPVIIECDTAAGQPVRVRLSADEQEQVLDRMA